MTNRELTILAIKVFAIYILFQAITIVAQLGSFLDVFLEGDKWSLLLPILAIFGLIITFVFLWKLSNSVASNMTRNVVDNDDFKIDQVFILNLVGFYVVVISLLGLIQGGISLFFQSQNYSSNFVTQITPQSIFYIIANILKLILGISLIIKPIGWAKLFKRFRTLGTK